MRATNNFNDQQQIGYGAGSEVFAGTLEGVDVAVKLFKQVSSDLRLWDLEDMFEAELKLLSEISHPNIVKLLGFASSRRHACLVLERLPTDLAQRLLRLPPSETGGGAGTGGTVARA